MSMPPVLGKEGIWSLVFGQHRFCGGAFLFPLVASLLPARRVPNLDCEKGVEVGNKYKASAIHVL
jgi:hypothetical protein